MITPTNFNKTPDENFANHVDNQVDNYIDNQADDSVDNQLDHHLKDPTKNKPIATLVRAPDISLADDALAKTQIEPLDPLTDNPQLATENMTENLPCHIKLTGRMLNFTRLQLQGNNITELLAKIEQKLGNQRHTRLPVVVSCEHQLDLPTLWQGLWQLGLQPIGIVTGVLDEQAQAMCVAIFPADGERIDRRTKPSSTPTAPPSFDTSLASTESVSKPISEKVTDTATDRFTVNPPHSSNTDNVSHMEGDLVWTQMLRSGQSINHVGGDLILTRGLNAGAEAITDYSLHVYGKAEGRLVAGATGDKNAKIFCLRFNPSLVSVAGTYCLRENIPNEFLNQAVQISYRDEQGLVFELLET